MSFKDLHQALSYYFDENSISGEEFLLLYNEYYLKSPVFEYDYEQFDFDKIGDAECKANF